MAGRVAIVVQRYGREVLGGSETLAADIAASLSKPYAVDVLTTCAKEYETWANVYPPGESEQDGFTVKRFPVDSPRHLLFKPFNVVLRNVPHTRGAERLWMRMQGPYSSGLIKYVADHKDYYDAFVFVTYMYGTTYYCLPLVREKAILVPTAHDEPYIRYGIFRDIFLGARRLIYLTEEEKALADGLFSLDKAKGVVAGAPVMNGTKPTGDLRSRYGIEGDFVLYAGRLDRFKGVHVLLKYFKRYRRESRSDIGLVLCGTGPMRISENGGVKKIGYVPDADKHAAMAEAVATIVPSKFESFSYSLLESLANGTPALVNGACRVLKGHCARSGGCICYESYEDFRAAMDRVQKPGIRDRLGRAGRKYVSENYSREAVGRKYISTIDGLVNDRRRSS